MKNERWRSSLQLLTTVDEKRSHTDARNKRSEGTCQWLFHREEYRDWLSGKTNNLLWVHGTRKSNANKMAHFLTSFCSWKWQNRSCVSFRLYLGLAPELQSTWLTLHGRSAIIDRLAETPSDKKIGLAYFYCNYKDPARQSLSELFGSLLAQLTQQTLVYRHPVWEYLVSRPQTLSASTSLTFQGFFAEIVSQHSDY
jgi:hypothetical protein